MNQKTEEYIKTAEILTKFKNSEKMYNESPLFHRVVQMMANGMSESEVIERLIEIAENGQKALEFYLLRDTRPMNFYNRNKE
jgi:glycerol-3-phosphate dehydrogenase